MRPTPVFALLCALLASGCAEPQCTRNTDCGDRARCELDRCVSDCRADRDCPSGRSCTANGECVAPKPTSDVPVVDAAPDVLVVDAAPDVAVVDAAPDVAVVDAAPDVPAVVDAAPDVPAVVDAAPDVPAVVDAAPDVAGFDAFTNDAPSMDAPDVPDVRDVVDVVDVVDVADVVDVVDVADVRDVSDVPVAPDAGRCTPLPWTMSVVAGAGEFGGSTAISLDAAGAPTIVFHRSVDGSYPARQVLVATRRGAMPWDLELAAQGAYNDRHQTTDVVRDLRGVPHVVYPGQQPAPARGVVTYHAAREAGRWTVAPMQGGNTWGTIGRDDEGTLWAVSGSTEINVARRPVGDTSWRYEVQAQARCIASAVTPSGELHVAYMTPPTSTTSINNLGYGVRTRLGVWRIGTLFSVGAHYDYDCKLAMDVSPSGEPHILYTGTGGIRHAFRGADRTWRSEVFSPVGSQFAVAVDAQGGVHVAYGDPLQYGYLPPGGAWQLGAVELPPMIVPGADPSIAVDATGAAHIASYMTRRGSSYNVHYITGRRCAP